jgi:hypothetical protein
MSLDRSGRSVSAKNLGTVLIAAVLVIVGMLATPGKASAQYLEVSGGWAHSTGNFGLDGFNAEAGWWLSHRVVGAADYDNMYDTSHIGVFDFTQVGPIAIKSHLQDFLAGPRVYFATKDVKGFPITPFAELQFGVSHLGSTVRQTNSNVSGSSTAFSWMLGGGADYRVSPHWSARAKLGLLRTHLNEEGQSRLRFVLTAAYTFGSR